MSMPNLDCMDQSELERAASLFHRLSVYAELKVRAMTLRKSGKIEAAIKDENDCEKIYQSLPSDWRW